MKSSSAFPVPSGITLSAPAKINWFLKIVGARDDGYHDIESLMQCVNLYDTLIFEQADALEIECSENIPVQDNLVYRAANLLKERTSCRKGARITLKKDIPIGAGLGGGSSDAASSLMGLNVLWALGLSREALREIGSRLGADIPFFFDGPSALIGGRGELVASFRLESPVVLLLVKPPFPVSTTWAYSAFDRVAGMQAPSSPVQLKKKTIDIKLFRRALCERDFAALAGMNGNDLEKIVIERYPVIKEIKEGLLKAGAALSAMSGSGPTVFGVFENRDMAEKAAVTMSPNWRRVVETLV
ncbi:MAG: 4-(cytidine 5'-diphospho)-2-C-methyl-D-erythritol kinase [Nitrospirota bacterium]